MKRMLSLTVLLLLSMAAPGLAATIYIDKSAATCSNYNPATRLCSGGSAQNYNDFQSNMDTIMPDGTIAEVRAGTYTGAMNTGPTCSANNRCIIRSYQNETVLWRPVAGSGGRGPTFFHDSGSTYVTLSGAGSDNGKHFTIDCDLATSACLVFYNLSHHITVTNLIIRDTPNNSCVDWWHTSVNNVQLLNSTIINCGDTATQDHAIYVRGSNNTIRGNTVSNTVGGCVHIWENTNNANDNLVEYNDLSDCDVYGILTSSGDRNMIRYNTVYGYHGYGIRVGSNGSQDTLIYNNTIYGGTDSTPCIENQNGAIRTVVKNNICQGGVDNTIDNLASTGTVSSNTTNGSASFKDAPDDFSLTTNISGTASILGSTSGTTFSATVSISCNGTCSQGAHNSPIFASCTVEDGDATKVRVLFTTGSTMRGSAAGNWAAVVAGSGVSESAVTVVGTTRADITVPAVTNGQSVTIAYTAPASSPLSDSLAIGGTRHSAVRSFTAQSCTNNVGSAPATTLEQIHFEWFEWYGAEDTGRSLQYRACGEDQGCEFPTHSRVLLRLKMVCSGGDCDPTTVTVRYSLEGGSYTEIPNVVATDKIHYAACPNTPHLTDTTERLTAGSALFMSGKILGEQAALPNVDLDEDDATEFGYCIGWTGATVTDTYDFRLYTQSGGALDTYTVTPRATIGYGGMVMKAP